MDNLFFTEQQNNLRWKPCFVKYFIKVIMRTFSELLAVHINTQNSDQRINYDNESSAKDRSRLFRVDYLASPVNMAILAQAVNEQLKLKWYRVSVNTNPQQSKKRNDHNFFCPFISTRYYYSLFFQIKRDYSLFSRCLKYHLLNYTLCDFFYLLRVVAIICQLILKLYNLIS